MSTETSRDVEKVYSLSEMAAKLRRLADALETGKPFQIQIAGERIRVPSGAVASIEHERGDEEEEIEFQLKWTLADAEARDAQEEDDGEDEDSEDTGEVSKSPTPMPAD